MSKTDGEALIVEFHDVAQRCCRAVMNIRSARRQAPQDRPLQLADIGTLAGDRGATDIGDLEADPRTIETTWREIGALLDNFTSKECANYLANSGYASA